MSDSELSDAPARRVPSDEALEKALRKETAKQFEDPLKSVNSIRRGAEDALDLDTGFFADDEAWKARSKAVIKKEIEILENAGAPTSRTFSANSSPAKPKVTQLTPKAAPKKRPSLTAEKPPKKRQKKSLPKENSSSPPTEDSNIDPKARVKKKKSATKAKDTPPARASKESQTNGKPRPKLKTQDPGSVLSNAPAVHPDSVQASDKFEDDSGSETSVLIDDEPQPKKKRKSKDSSEKPKKTVNAKPAIDDDPELEEIKRLQGWLVKCGIRKIWAFELKPYDTSKAKISHLKEMLSDVGMTGRYSLEKASQIKEARELAADIEAVQEGNEIWGKDGEDRSRRSKRSDHAGIEDGVDDEDSAPKRKLVQGPKRYDFLSSDGEESD